VILIGSCVINQAGVGNRVEIYKSGRSGSKAPISFYIKHKNRWVSQYEQKIRHWGSIPLDILLKALYSFELFRDLVFQANPFLASVLKGNGFCGTYLPVPLK